MAYKALYREYRPQTFEEVVGQKYIVKTLQNAILNNKVAHAYLFTGPRGTGKTTIAKLIAKALNCTCENHKPCGDCEHCKAIAAGTFPDVIEIDAASNNGAEDAREIVDKAKYAPMEGKYKVYIIDEVHMMTSSAFNALLKTLEEPPENVVFILATTEVHKVLPTIISRCQRFDFGRISNLDLQERIISVLKGENIDYEEGVPALVAKLADGGVRDALGILDQSIVYASGRLTQQDVRDIYGILSNEEAIKFLSVIERGSVAEALEHINLFDRKGIDFSRLTSHLIDILKDGVVYNKTTSVLNLSTLTREDAQQLTAFLSSDKCFEYIDILMEALATYKRVNAVRSFFELAILKMCNTKAIQDIHVCKCEDIVDKTTISEHSHEEVQEETIEVQEEEMIEEIEEKEEISEVKEPVEEKEEQIEENEGPVSVLGESDMDKLAEELKNSSNIGIKEENKAPLENKETFVKPVSEGVVTSSMLINVMVQAKPKETRLALCNMWNSVTRYLSIPKFKKAANILRDATIACVAEDALILITDTDSTANIINSKDNYLECKELIEELLGKKYKYMAIDNNLFKQVTMDYKSRSSLNTLPEPTEIKDLYNIEELSSLASQNIQEDPIIKENEDFFGDIFEVE